VWNRGYLLVVERAMAADLFDITIVFITALTFAVIGAMAIGAMLWVLIIPKD
jgi:hypothetical protein